MNEPALEERVRGICLALPGATEKVSHGAPAVFAGKQFLMLWVYGHHDHQFPQLWCAAPPGAQEELVATEGERFFRPPYVGGRGWLGLRLDGKIDWNEVEAICVDAYRAVASKTMLAGFRRAELTPPSIPIAGTARARAGGRLAEERAPRHADMRGERPAASGQG